MGFNSSSIAEVTEHRNTLYKDGELRYWLDPEQLSAGEIKQLILLKQREAACSYLGLPLDCDDITLAKAEKAESLRIDTAYAQFVEEQRIKEEERTQRLEAWFQAFLYGINQFERQVAGILW